MPHYGLYITSHELDFGLFQVGDQRATVFTPMTENGWCTALGGWIGRYDASNPTVRFAMWSGTVGHPNVRMGYVSSFTPSTAMPDGNSGTQYEQPVTTVNSAYSPGSAIFMAQGNSYALGALVTGFRLGNAERADGNVRVTGKNTQLYIKGGLSQPPTDPFTSYDSSNVEGWMAFWATYTSNTVPTTPTSAGNHISPALNAVITTTTPTFNVDFLDAEISLGDQMSSYHVQLRIQGTTTNLWDSTYPATSTEIAADQIQRVYGGGTALVQGGAYEWRVFSTDFGGESSNYGIWWQFTVNAGGVVTNFGTPSGQQAGVNGFTYQGKWFSSGGLSTTHVQARLLRNGTVVSTGASIARVVASSGSPGTSFNITHSESGFADLGRGLIYQYQIRGQDSAGVWSPWSTSISTFNIDAIPAKPSALFPNKGTAAPAAPFTHFNMTDADDTPTSLGGTLTAQQRIKFDAWLANPNFQNDIGGWGLDAPAPTGITAAATYDGTTNLDGVVGTGSLKLTISANSAAGSTTTTVDMQSAFSIPCVAGETYTVHAWVMTNTAGVHPVLGFRWRDSGDSFQGSSFEADWTPTINTPYSRTFSAVAPAGATFYRPAAGALVPTTATTGAVWFDGFNVDKAPRFTRTPTWNNTLARWEYQTTQGVNQVDTIHFTGTVTGGTYTITVDGATTTALAFNASAATVNIALLALSTVALASLPADNVVTTGGPGPTDLVVTWGDWWAGTPRTVSVTSSVTGGGSVARVATTAGTRADTGPFGTYTWDARGSDGTLFGPYADEYNFVLQAGPAPLITAPTGTITTGTPTFIWSVTGTKYRLRIWSDAALTLQVYDTGTVTSGAGSLVLPSNVIHNGFTYYATVVITNAASQTGTSPVVSFTVSYTPATTITGVSATAITGLYDRVPSMMQINWSATDVPPERFGSYVITRRPNGYLQSQETVMAQITNPAQLSWTDTTPQSGRTYIWSVYQLNFPALGNSDLVASSRTEVSGQVVLAGVVISDALQGTIYRAVLRYDLNRSDDPVQNIQFAKTWQQQAPTALIDTTDYEVIQGEFQIANNPQNGEQAADLMEALRTIRKNKRIVCYRDERGRRYFGILTKVTENDVRVQAFTAAIEFTETAFQEGLIQK